VKKLLSSMLIGLGLAILAYLGGSLFSIDDTLGVLFLGGFLILVIGVLSVIILSRRRNATETSQGSEARALPRRESTTCVPKQLDRGKQTGIGTQSPVSDVVKAQKSPRPANIAGRQPVIKDKSEWAGSPPSAPISSRTEPPREGLYPAGATIAGRYEIAGKPMMGAMGVVYIAFDHQDQRPVAIKTFRPEYLSDRAARDRFLREGTAWVDLGVHPHIVRCYEVTRVGDGTEVYLILELVAREQGYPDASLRPWLIPGRPLPVETALLFALQIARGMGHAVERIPGFVHRDLKPENVLVGADRLPDWNVNRVRVTDFGLASVLEAESKPETSGRTQQPASSDRLPASRTQLTHGIVGTPLYMAPEQWRGEPVGVYTDIYALGCILYEMLAGQQAALGDSLAALQRTHCTGRDPAPAGERPGPCPRNRRALPRPCACGTLRRPVRRRRRSRDSSANRDRTHRASVAHGGGAEPGRSHRGGMVVQRARGVLSGHR